MGLQDRYGDLHWIAVPIFWNEKEFAVKKVWFVMATVFALFVLIVRIEPAHFPNVVPLGAFAMWAGSYLGKRTAMFCVLATLAVSDLILGGYAWQIMATVYLATVLFVPLGIAVRLFQGTWWQKAIAPFVGVGVGSTMFFFLTNSAVWLFGGLYPRTVSGLGACLVAGLPFFRNSMYGDLYGIGIFFGISVVLTTLAALFRQEVAQQTGFCSRS